MGATQDRRMEMKWNSYEKYIAVIFECIENRKTVNYENKKSVCIYNRAFDKCIKYIMRIDAEYPVKLDDFLDIVLSSGNFVIGHCAQFFFKMQNATVEQKLRLREALFQLLFSPDVSDWEKWAIRKNFERGWYDV